MKNRNSLIAILRDLSKGICSLSPLIARFALMCYKYLHILLVSCFSALAVPFGLWSVLIVLDFEGLFLRLFLKGVSFSGSAIVIKGRCHHWE